MLNYVLQGTIKIIRRRMKQTVPQKVKTNFVAVKANESLLQP